MTCGPVLAVWHPPVAREPVGGSCRPCMEGGFDWNHPWRKNEGNTTAGVYCRRWQRWDEQMAWRGVTEMCLGESQEGVVQLLAQRAARRRQTTTIPHRHPKTIKVSFIGCSPRKQPLPTSHHYDDPHWYNTHHSKCWTLCGVTHPKNPHLIRWRAATMGLQN